MNLMNRDQAMAYGKKHGCKFYVYNDCGGLMGGFKEKQRALDYIEELKAEYKNDPWNSGMTFYIKEV